MWQKDWRDQIWSRLDETWDLIIVGGGITGAGILREAVRLGLRALLVEQRDFAWGTSSRSSKLVHGGLRYLKEGQIGLTRASVQERENLLAQAPGLVEPLGFLLATYEGDRPGKFIFRAGLTIYDLLALQWSHRYHGPTDFEFLAPHLDREGLQGGFQYGDAQTDDARLVLRLLQEAVAESANGAALNYVRAEGIERRDGGFRVQLHDSYGKRQGSATASVVVSATGAWADELRGQLGQTPRIRPLRGSHLVFPAWRLPVAQAISFLHPIDRRPVFLFPWEGATLVGTTDLDHDKALNREPRIAPEEVAYLMAAVTDLFPSLALTLSDIVATFAGVRPVLDTGAADPSHESRDHAIWDDNGLLTVTGGKLTTFRPVALAVLEQAAPYLTVPIPPDVDLPAFDPVPATLPEPHGLSGAQQERLTGRYGQAAAAVVAAAAPEELNAIPGTNTLWAELRWAARAEGVCHLEDLLLRRVRLGLLRPNGGLDEQERIRAICQVELGWDDGRWTAEVAAYERLWQTHYGPPDPETVPDWRRQVAVADARRDRRRREKRERRLRRAAVSGGLGGLALGLILAYWLGTRHNET